MNKNVVLYHAGCQDGHAAAWVARHYYGKEVELIPVNHGQEPPEIVDGNAVTILDFSYRCDVLEAIASRAVSLLVIDHHASAAGELRRLEQSCPAAKVVFDLERSGCRMAWDYYFPGQAAPWFIDYAQDRDLWQWKLPFSKEISAAMASYPHDFQLWDNWAENGEWIETLSNMNAKLEFAKNRVVAGMIEQGTAILRYQQQMVDTACKNAVEIELDGHKVLSVNATMLVSEIGQQLCKARPFSATYFIRGSDGKKIWSLRSEEGGLDVGEIAKRHGGGGHKHAAGFQE